MKNRILWPLLLGISVALVVSLLPIQNVSAQQCGGPNGPPCPPTNPPKVKRTKTPTLAPWTKTPTPTETPSPTETPKPTDTLALTDTPEFTDTPDAGEIVAFHTKYPLDNPADPNAPSGPNPAPNSSTLFGGGTSLTGILIGLLVGILIGLLVGILIGLSRPGFLGMFLKPADPVGNAPFHKDENSLFIKFDSTSFHKTEDSLFHKDENSPFHKGEDSLFHKDDLSQFHKGEDSPFHKDDLSQFHKGEDSPFHKGELDG